jgi:cation diffusion facilitator family transporter
VAGPEGGAKAVVAALIANAGIAIAKFVGFAVTGSSSMLAESVHSVADCGNQGLLLLGGRTSKRRATRAHPFGYGRDRYFWAFFVAVVLFTRGSGFALYEGIQKVRDPHELESPGVAVAILVFGIVIEGWSFRTAIVEAAKIKGDSSWFTFTRRTKSAELAVVLLEDAGALVGLVVALAAVGLVQATGEPLFDVIGTIVIGVLLGAISIALGIEMRSLLIGEAAAPGTEDTIRAAIVGVPAITDVIHMRTEHLGPDELLVGAKIALDPDLDVPGVAAAINDAEAAVRSAVPIARVIYLEPDIARGDVAVGTASGGSTSEST